jgi:hypothetical protein
MGPAFAPVERDGTVSAFSRVRYSEAVGGRKTAGVRRPDIGGHGGLTAYFPWRPVAVSQSPSTSLFGK